MNFHRKVMNFHRKSTTFHRKILEFYRRRWVPRHVGPGARAPEQEPGPGPLQEEHGAPVRPRESLGKGGGQQLRMNPRSDSRETSCWPRNKADLLNKAECSRMVRILYHVTMTRGLLFWRYRGGRSCFQLGESRIWKDTLGFLLELALVARSRGSRAG